MTGRRLVAERMLAWTGLDLERGGRHDALDRVLAQRMRARQCASVDEYARALSGPNDPEVLQLLEVLTVGHTWFFRDEEQTAEVSRVLQEAAAPGHGVVRVWVAGCSTGEEAYTLALLGEAAGVALDVLATDVNSEAIARAREARFGEWSIRLVPPSLRRFFTPAADGTWALDPRVRSRVRFERHNLMDAAPPGVGEGREDRFDLVCCRNVLIYFGRAEAARTLERLAASLSSRGTLFLGAGEVVSEAPSGYRLVQLGARFALRRRANTPDAPKSEARVAARPTTPPAITSPLPSPLPSPSPSPPATATTAGHELIELALARIEAGAAAEAIAMCIKAVEGNPISADAHLVLGVAFHMNGDAAAAEDALRAALYLDPESWLASFYLGRTYERLGRHDEAARAYTHVEEVATAPDKKDGTGRLAPAFATLQAWQDEISALARAKLVLVKGRR